MGRYNNLKRVIDWVEKFELQLPDGAEWDDRNFATWLNKELNTPNQTETELLPKQKSSLAMPVYFMYKYALFYSRKIFKNTLIYSLDDFSFLASLLPDKKLKKADVIRKNIAEKSSGNEVIKRLLKHQLIKETNNPNDKRSKLLELTPAGFTQINAVRNQMYKMSSLVEGDLSEQEKTDMLNMLSKLHNFHNPLFEANDEKILHKKLGID